MDYYTYAADVTTSCVTVVQDGKGTGGPVSGVCTVTGVSTVAVLSTPGDTTHGPDRIKVHGTTRVKGDRT